MTVKGVKCLKCNDTVFSRVRHDFKSCSCHNVSVDGGFDYLKVSCEDPEETEYAEIEVDATESELWDDWNKRKDKYGLIKG